MIFLAFIDKNEKEHHMAWDNSDSTFNLTSAKIEVGYMREMALRNGDKPYDCFVYESDKVQDGFVEEVMDVGAFLSFPTNNLPTVRGKSATKTMKALYALH